MQERIKILCTAMKSTVHTSMNALNKHLVFRY
jgi:hypothetical protein